MKLTIGLLGLSLYPIYGQDLPEQIVLFATYRDFLPIQCLLNTNNGKNEIDAAWSPRDFEDLNNENACAVLEAANTGGAFDPAIANRDISGHPDFEASGLFRNSNDCDAVNPVTKLHFPNGTCVFEEGELGALASIVSNDLIEGENGLLQIQYCTDVDGDDSRCGFYSNNNNVGDVVQTQSTKGNFDKWYKDDLSVNRRIGQRLFLKPKEGTESTFAFAPEDDEASDFPEENLVNGIFFGPIDRFKETGTREIDASVVAVEDAPAWPTSSAGRSDDNLGFWFTTEIHSTFEFRSDADMFFNFSGDDDFWCFINGKLAVDVGGLHPPRSKSIDLNTPNPDGDDTIVSELGLEDGQVYTLDIFHAERQRGGSNFELTTTLFAACNVIQSGEDSFNLAETVNEEDFETLFLADGVTLFDERSFQIMSSDQEFTGTHIFTRVQENLQPGFNAKFLARIDGQTEGFAFVVQAQGIEDFPKRAGRTFNFDGLTASFAVLFDLCVERDSSNNCVGQDLRLHFPDNSTFGNNPDPVAAANGGTRRVHDRILRDLNRNEAFPVEISFFGDSPDFLEVYVNNSLYIRQKGFSVEDIIGSAGAHVGFTAGSTDKAGNVYIEDFSLSIVAVDPRRTQIALEQPSNETVVADGVSKTEGFVIFTEDLCTNPFQSGTQQDLISARFFEVPNEDELVGGRRTLLNSEGNAVFVAQEEAPAVVDAFIQDNLDGTYALQLQTEVVGEFLLAVAFGEGCKVEFEEVTEQVVVDDETVDVVSLNPVLVADDETQCSFLEFDESIVAIPAPTGAPIAFEEAVEVEEFNVLVAAGVGSGLCFMVLVFAVIFAIYRAKWQRDKKFIEKGNAYKLDINTVVFDGEYTAAGQAVLETQKEILALKAAAEVDPRSKDINSLKNENEEMKNLIKQAKTDSAVATAVQSNNTKKPKVNRKRRQEF